MNDDMYHFLLAEGNETFQRLSMTDEPELIPEREAFRAYFVIENLRLVDNPEAYLFCTALNLLNRFVKQFHGISYTFKRRIDRLISYLSRHPQKMSWRRQSIHNILEHLSAEDQKKFLNLKLSLD